MEIVPSALDCSQPSSFSLESNEAHRGLRKNWMQGQKGDTKGGGEARSEKNPLSYFFLSFHQPPHVGLSKG